MRVELHGMVFDTPAVSFYLWSPWRCSDLEHRLFKALQQLPGADLEEATDELRVHLSDPKVWRASLQVINRVMKGWQEEASDVGDEKRFWRWLFEADCDPDGFDYHGDPLSLWAFLRLTLDRSRPGESDRPEDLDLDGFGVRVWGHEAKKRGR